MSWGTCYSASNNIHFNYPPIMMDGRNYGTNLSHSIINDKIKFKNNIKSNYSYRQFLIKNAVALMNSNKIVACDDCGACLGQFNTYPTTSTKKHIFIDPNDTTAPYGYETSNLKNMYLSRLKLNEKAKVVYTNIL